MFAILFACFLKCRAIIVNENFNDNVTMNESLFFIGNHWLYDYGYDSNYVNLRSASNRKVNEANCCWLGIKYPHQYKIKCSDCEILIKQGKEKGTFPCALLVGMLGIILGVVIFIIVKFAEKQKIRIFFS